jgi:uncharacterized protein YPO0396
MPEPPEGWTLDTLFYHFNERIDTAREAAKVALTAAEKAIAKAETASEKRFESVNEFRGALTDASKNNIARAEVDSRFEAVTDKIKDLGDRLNRIEYNKQGLMDGWKIMVAILSLVVVVLGIISAIKHW